MVRHQHISTTAHILPWEPSRADAESSSWLRELKAELEASQTKKIPVDFALISGALVSGWHRYTEEGERVLAEIDLHLGNSLSQFIRRLKRHYPDSHQWKQAQVHVMRVLACEHNFQVMRKLERLTEVHKAKKH